MALKVRNSKQLSKFILGYVRKIEAAMVLNLGALVAAATGLLLILSTYLILQVINPELTTLKLPDIN